MADQFATSFGVLNYSGLLFNRNNVRTPLVNSLARRTVQSVEFVVSSEYAQGTPSQPAISEMASLTAPDAKIVTRSQDTNVTQIFQKATGISYGKMANMATMAHDNINIANQQSNVLNELDFQVGVKMAEIGADLEYTLLNGTYNKATTDAEINKTKGFSEAIKTNVIDAKAGTLNHDLINDALQAIREKGGSTQDVVFMVSPVIKRQITKYYNLSNGFLLPASRNVGGLAIDQIVTDFGTIGIIMHDMVKPGECYILNLGVCKIVEQPVPGKGNFFWEELARVGAGIKGHIFGQAGLDFGPEWFHAKFVNVANTHEVVAPTAVAMMSEAPVATRAKK